MKLYTYWKDGAEHIGVGCDEDSLYPVEAFGLSFAGMTDLIRRITMEEKKRLADPKNAVGARGAKTVRAHPASGAGRHLLGDQLSCARRRVRAF